MPTPNGISNMPTIFWKEKNILLNSLLSFCNLDKEENSTGVVAETISPIICPTVDIDVR